MVNKSYNKLRSRVIKKNTSRYFSIVLIVALGVGFLFGIFSAGPEMKRQVSNYMIDSATYDIEITSNYGFNENSIDEINMLNNIDLVYPEKTLDKLIRIDSNSYVASIVERDFYSKNLANNITLIEGSLPASDKECAIEKYESTEDISLGDTIEVDNQLLKIVGIVDSSLSLSYKGNYTNIGSGVIDIRVYTTPGFLDLDVYTKMYLVLDDSKNFEFGSDAYSKYIETTKSTIESNVTMILNDSQDDFISALNEEVAINEILLNEEIENSARILEETYYMPHDLAIETINEDQKIIDAKDEINAAYEKIGSLDELSINLAYRTDNNGINSFILDITKVEAIAKIFPVFFFIVVGLVVFTSIKRLIEEDRLQLGTLKSLGYSNTKILNIYMYFTFSATVFGSFLGFMFGQYILMPMIVNAYQVSYDFTFANYYYNYIYATLIFAVMLLIIVLTTIIVTCMDLSAKPAELLIQKAPKAGKRMLLEKMKFIWKYLNFTQKITYRNLFRYKARLVMTVIGISGCLALLVAGFGLSDSLQDVANIQYENISKYQVKALLEDDGDINELDIEDYILLSENSSSVSIGDHSESVQVLTPQNSFLLNSYIELNEDFDNSKVVIGQKLALSLDAEVGDMVTVTINNKDYKLKITSIYTTYLENYMLIGKDYLSSENYQTIFVKTEDSEAVVKELLSNENIVYAVDNNTIKDTYNQSMESLNSIVVLIVVLSTFLEAVVLYNLININISERKKELATIEVLGFYDKEIYNYVFSEIRILGLLGIVVGVPLGYLLHYYLISEIESTQYALLYYISPQSIAFSIILTYVFLELVNLVMKRKIHNIDMIEALKEVE